MDRSTTNLKFCWVGTRGYGRRTDRLIICPEISDGNIGEKSYLFVLAVRPMRKRIPMSAVVCALASTASRSWAWRPIISKSRQQLIRLTHPAQVHPSALLLTRLYSSSSQEQNSQSNTHSFQRGDAVQVQVMSFGPLGASVDVIAASHDDDQIIPETEPPLAKGLILQKEISYFRQARNNVDVVLSEVLPAYVEHVRDDQKLDIGLRKFGGRAKTLDVAEQLMERLQKQKGRLAVGDKSSPQDIAREFPGVNKASFKKAVAALYKQGKVKPGPDSVTLLK